MYTSAVVQSLPTSQIYLCSNLNYTPSNYIIDYTYTVKLNIEMSQKDKTGKILFFPDKTTATICQFTRYQVLDMGMYKPNEKRMLRLFDKLYVSDS